MVTGIVQRVMGKNVSINLGKADAVLTENEQVKGETFQPTERVKVYILEVKDTPKGPRILVSRTHPGLVKRLFESEVAEVRDGTVEIKSIAREAGSRTKMAVWSNDPNVDPVGACVGMNGARVNAVVKELRGEKIDIINWDENPALLIENALSPAKVISVMADPDESVEISRRTTWSRWVWSEKKAIQLEKRKKSTMMFRQMQLMKTEQMRLNSLRQTKSKI